MRFYGTIETNLGQVYNGYSVDCLTFTTPNDETIHIDFEEADMITEDTYITFRLKSMGTTFIDSWDVIGSPDVQELENNYELFKKCDLDIIVLYTDDEKLTEDRPKITFTVQEAKLDIQGKTIDYKNVNVEHWD